MVLHAHGQTKIVFFISSFRAGGGEKQMIEIANTFADRGYEVDLLVLKQAGDLERIVGGKVRVFSLDSRRIVFSLPKLMSYFRKRKPNALLSVDEHTHILSIIAKMFTMSPVRIVLRVGNMLSILESHYVGKSKILPFLNRRLLKRANLIIANSRGVADDLISVTGISLGRVVVILNPKPLGEILEKAREPLKDEWFLNKESPVIVAVGRLRVQKNFQLLIRAFAKLPKELNARLVIVGGGREEQRLKKLAEDLLCAERVHFTGYVPNPYPYMTQADLFVATSLWEGLPNAVIEALVCGAPTIASDCSSGPREILAPDTDYRKRLVKGHGIEYAKYGVLFAVDDEDALVEAMTKMLGDAPLRAKYSALSKERAEAFDSEYIVDEYARALGLNNQNLPNV